MSTPVAAPVYERLVRPLLFQLDPETAHRLGQFALRHDLLWSLLPRRRDDERLAVRAGDWDLKSPIGLAAGFDKDGTAVPGLQHLGFDYVTVGSVLHHIVGRTRRRSRALAAQALQNAWSLVAPGGILAVVEPTFSPSISMTALFYVKRFFARFTGDRIVLLKRFDNNIGPPVVSYLLPRQLRALCAALPDGDIVLEEAEEGTITGGWKLLGIRQRLLITLAIQRRPLP